MSIRIEKIKIKREGPLKEDFYFEPGGFNLVYGPNETGKSLVVEAIISLLFKTGKKPKFEWGLRQWDLAGNVQVSGLGENPVSFTKTGKKLEDYWEEMENLPQDFSRLMVVKEGEVFLFDQGDTTGHGFLKKYLSGEGMLDVIQERIKATIKNAGVGEGKITGSNTGEIRKRNDALDKRNRLEKLISSAQAQYASGELSSLERKLKSLQAEFDGLEKARQHQAFCKREELKELEVKIARLPDEEKLSSLTSLISVYNSKKKEMEDKLAEAEKLKSNADKYNWARKARDIYIEAAGQSAAKPGIIVFILALLALAGSVASGWLGFNPGMAIGAGVSVLLLILYFTGWQRAISTAGESRELERIKAEYREIFGTELASKATLDKAIEEMGKAFNRSEDLQREVNSSILPDIRQKESEISTRLKEYKGREVEQEEWQDAIRSLRQERERLNSQISEIKEDLAWLGVNPEQYLSKDPGVKWDPVRYSKLDEDLRETNASIEQEREELKSLKHRISMETNCDSDDMAELFNRLQELYEGVQAEYHSITAEILGKIYVNRVVEDLRQKENERIASGLESKELLEPLYQITGRYTNIHFNPDAGLRLISKEGEDFPLNMLSTGAREQVFLAMRLGFARIAMKGQSAFMILDDAFQHSDWNRRSNLVERIAELTGSGWQVFYFTMDDHVKELFLEAGQKLGDQFKHVELK